jgi:hypothetical protein
VTWHGTRTKVRNQRTRSIGRLRIVFAFAFVFISFFSILFAQQSIVLSFDILILRTLQSAAHHSPHKDRGKLTRTTANPLNPCLEHFNTPLPNLLHILTLFPTLLLGLHLVTSSGDDKNPVLKLWDLRSSTSLPLATLQGRIRIGIRALL